MKESIKHGLTGCLIGVVGIFLVLLVIGYLAGSDDSATNTKTTTEQNDAKSDADNLSNSNTEHTASGKRIKRPVRNYLH